MDDTGSAEVTRGKKPDSIRLVGIENPSTVGYLADNRLAFADYSQIPIYNTELREISRLVGFGSDDGVEIVHRPTFESMGEQNVFVASDKTCVKIFDLRSAKTEMTIHQECLHSTPIPVNGNKFLCNKLEDGRAQMWDLRTQQALYSLPVSRDNDFVWVPTEDLSSAALLTLLKDIGVTLPANHQDIFFGLPLSICGPIKTPFFIDIYSFPSKTSIPTFGNDDILFINVWPGCISQCIGSAICFDTTISSPVPNGNLPVSQKFCKSNSSPESFNHSCIK